MRGFLCRVKPDGSTTTTTYDAAGRVLSTVETLGTTTISGFEYVYDSLGRIASETDLANELKLCYTYDTLSRVTARTTIKPADSETVTNVEYFYYDAAGNVTQPRAVVAYDANNRLTLFNGNDVTYILDYLATLRILLV